MANNWQHVAETSITAAMTRMLKITDIPCPSEHWHVPSRSEQTRVGRELLQGASR